MSNYASMLIGGGPLSIAGDLPASPLHRPLWGKKRAKSPVSSL
jgi:hypothetical protein